MAQPQKVYPDPHQSYGQPPPPQHMQQQSTTVIVNQPQAHNQLLIGSVHGHRQWSTGLCDCFSDIGTCLFTWFCYQCAMCQLASRTGECMCVTCFVPGAEINLRTRIRTLGGIQGSMCNDCLTVACCGPCAACQEARELKNMGI